MLYYIIVMLVLLIVCWVWGEAFTNILKIKQELQLFKVSVGFALLIIFLNLMYFRLDLPIELIKNILAICSVLFFLHNIKNIRKSDFVALLLIFMFFLIFAGLGILSQYRGFGESFYVFRGNVDDHYNYISMGYAIYKHEFSYYLNATEEMLFAENDLLIQGAYLLRNDRPAISLPFSMLLNQGVGSIFWCAYLYMSFLYAMMAPVLFYFFNCLIKKGKAIKFAFLSSYLLGFWGQLNFDLNAWSQLGAIALIFTVIRLVVLKLDKYDRHAAPLIGGGICFTLTSAFMVYPEASMIYAGGMAVFLFNFYIHKMNNRYVLKKMAEWTIIVLCSLLIIIVINSNYKSLFVFMKGQLISGITRISDDWRMFDSYWVGKNSSQDIIVNVLNHLISFVGFYFVVPKISEITKVIVIISEMVFLLTIILGTTYKFIKKEKELYKGSETKLLNELWLTYFLYFCVIIVFLAYGKNFWVLGKVMIWFSPIFYYIIGYHFIDIIRYKTLRLYFKWFSCLVIGLNLFLGSMRISLVWHGQSSWYNNYPTQEGLRNAGDWSYDDAALKNANIIRIENDFEGHQFHYLKQSILYANKNYYSSGNILLPYGSGTNMGKMPKKKYDSFIYLKVKDNGKRKLQYRCDLNGELPNDLIYQKIYLSPFDSLVVEKSGFLEGDPDGVWTTEKTARIKLIEPFSFDEVILKMEVTGYTNGSGEESGKKIQIWIGEEARKIKLIKNGIYTVKFKKVKGQEEIRLVTDKMLTPFDMGISEDDATNYGVRIKSIELIGP